MARPPMMAPAEPEPDADDMAMTEEQAPALVTVRAAPQGGYTVEGGEGEPTAARDIGQALHRVMEILQGAEGASQDGAEQQGFEDGFAERESIPRAREPST